MLASRTWSDFLKIDLDKEDDIVLINNVISQFHYKVFSKFTQIQMTDDCCISILV